MASLPPIFPARDSLGNPFNNSDFLGVTVSGVVLNPQPEFGNPIIGLKNTENRSGLNSLFANALLQYDIHEKITLNTSFGYLSRRNQVKMFANKFSIPNTNIANLVSSLFESDFNDEYAQAEVYLSINPLNKESQKVNLILGASALENTNDQSSRTASNFFVNTFEEANFTNVINSNNKLIFPDNSAKNRTASLYGKLNVELEDKYLLSASLRADGSSRFGADNR